jgi:hypothetical protein
LSEAEQPPSRDHFATRTINEGPTAAKVCKNPLLRLVSQPAEQERRTKAWLPSSASTTAAPRPIAAGTAGTSTEVDRVGGGHAEGGVDTANAATDQSLPLLASSSPGEGEQPAARPPRSFVRTSSRAPVAVAEASRDYNLAVKKGANSSEGSAFTLKAALAPPSRLPPRARRSSPSPAAKTTFRAVAPVQYEKVQASAFAWPTLRPTADASHLEGREVRSALYRRSLLRPVELLAPAGSVEAANAVFPLSPLRPAEELPSTGC